MIKDNISKKAPRVSVVMAIYKEPVEWMRLSIDSILNQSFSDFEFIIINDNPNRIENNEMLNSYAHNDSRVVVISNENNIGLTRSLNKGIKISKGEYIARMDADDIACPQRFEKQIQFLDQNRHIGICGTGVELFGDHNGFVFYPKEDDSVFLFLDSCFAHPTVIMRREIALLEYNEECPCAQDYELWNRAFSTGVSFYNIQEPLLKYRHSCQQISASRRKEQMAIAQNIRRKAYDYYSKMNGIGLTMTGVQLTLDNILTFSKKTKLPNKESSQFMYYLLLSNEAGLFSLLYFILRHKIYNSISLKNILRVLYHTLNGRDNKKY